MLQASFQQPYLRKQSTKEEQLYLNIMDDYEAGMLKLLTQYFRYLKTQVTDLESLSIFKKIGLLFPFYPTNTRLM